MMLRTLELVTILTLVAAAACASSAPSPDAFQPPAMISHGVPPDLHVPMPSQSGRSPIRVTIQVVIQADGRPDMSTFKASGMGAGENETALREWIQQASFRPAHRGTEAVDGMYETRLEAHVEVRRMH